MVAARSEIEGSHRTDGHGALPCGVVAPGMHIAVEIHAKREVRAAADLGVRERDDIHVALPEVVRANAHDGAVRPQRRAVIRPRSKCRVGHDAGHHRHRRLSEGVPPPSANRAARRQDRQPMRIAKRDRAKHIHVPRVGRRLHRVDVRTPHHDGGDVVGLRTALCKQCAEACGRDGGGRDGRMQAGAARAGRMGRRNHRVHVHRGFPRVLVGPNGQRPFDEGSGTASQAMERAGDPKVYRSKVRGSPTRNGESIRLLRISPSAKRRGSVRSSLYRSGHAETRRRTAPSRARAKMRTAPVAETGAVGSEEFREAISGCSTMSSAPSG
jgi:hypothetical protein